ncbi:MAG: SpoIVB peptidase [Agathobacter sp.]|nr:SpoIVB peptidase [Agathobacter sp.]
MRSFFIHLYKNLCWIYLCWLICFGYQLFLSEIPDKIYLPEGQELKIEASIPITIRVKEETDGKEVMQELIWNEIEDEKTEYSAVCYFLGVIPVKEIEVSVVAEQAVYASGRVVGIYEETNGVLVLQTTSVEALNGVEYEPAANRILEGDYITHINHAKVEDKEELIELINENGAQKMTVTLIRKNESIDVAVTPVPVEDNKFMLGLWVKDDMAGIGTLTYYETDGSFGALGHGITDGETGQILNTEKGTLYRMALAGIQKGKAGEPGELKGLIYYGKSNALGDISTNCKEGIYGTLQEDDLGKYSLSDQLYPVAYKQEIKQDKAYILSDISGEVVSYEIQISEVDYEPVESNKGIRFTVTDPDLIKLTGGIVQGMSGSPIIQNGRIVGAVTHVLVNDPARGYGIFIENMLEH